MGGIEDGLVMWEREMSDSCTNEIVSGLDMIVEKFTRGTMNIASNTLTCIILCIILSIERIVERDISW